VIVIAVVCLGCGDGGPKLYPATGTVTLDGKAVEGAEVAFVSDTAPVATGTTDASGKFKLNTGGKEGAAAGEYRVMVTKSSAPPSNMPANPTPEDMRKMAMDKTIPKPQPLLPIKYAAAQTTDLTATVTTDKAKNDFPLGLKP